MSKDKNLKWERVGELADYQMGKMDRTIAKKSQGIRFDFAQRELRL